MRLLTVVFCLCFAFITTNLQPTLLVASPFFLQTDTLHTQQPSVKMETTVTCPNCGHQENCQMQANSCRFFHKCVQCKKTIKPPKGECCVFCAYGTNDCPSKQVHQQKSNALVTEK